MKSTRHYSIQDPLKDLLSTLGLNSTQSTLYLTGLSLGSAPISRIASRANLHRVTAYDSMKSLVAQGIFLEEKKGSTSFFQPIHPDLLYQKQQHIVTKLETLLPELRDLMSDNPIKPRVHFVEGIESCKMLCRQLLEDTQSLDCLLGSPMKSAEMLAFIDGEFEVKRVKKHIKQRIVMSSKNVSAPTRVHQKKRLREKVILPRDMLTITCGVYLYGTHTVMYNFFSNEEMSAVIIESKQLYTTRRSLFNFFWKIV